MTSKTATRLLYLALALFMAASMTYFVMESIGTAKNVAHSSEYARVPFGIDSDWLTLTTVEGEAIAAGLRHGDRLLELNGQPFRSQQQIRERQPGGADGLRPGERLNALVKHADGSLYHASVRTVRNLPRAMSPSARWASILDAFVLPILCLLMGYWVAAARIRDRNAWLLLLLFAAPSVIVLQPTWWSGGWGVALELWYSALQLLILPSLLLFGIYFPERWRLDQRAPWAKWLLLAPIAACSVLLVGVTAVEYLAAPEWGRWSALASAGANLLNPLNFVCVVVYGVAMIDKLRSATTADARRRMQVLATGSLLGLGSLLVLIFLPRFGIQNSQHLGIVLVCVAIFFAAPLSFAYVVLVQRALDVRILLRMGTQYALARASLIAVQMGLIAFVFLRFLLPVYRRDNLAVAIPLTAAVLVIMYKLFAAHDSNSSRLQRWLDRKFFREAYDAELVLGELSDQARRFTEAAPLVDTVIRRIAEVLHVSSIAVFLRQGRSFRLQQALGIHIDPETRFEESSSAVRNLARSNQPATLYRENPDGWFLLAEDRERGLLNSLGSELLLPLAGRDRLLGFISLGAKRSEEPYTPSDLRLLQSVSTQAGLALEISALVHSLAGEAARRERIDREIEIAREVQERLFPQSIPKLPGHSIDGACRPAQGVGGDYYDVLPLDDGTLGLAIGDVSGKGISAALLMASLRASLRGMTMDGPADLARLMARVNRLVYESSATNRYATFFFGVYHPGSRLLRYVNAGHNPPYVLRGDELHTLEGGGPVIGLLPEATYEECHLSLEPGDLLLAYTDGISEALNLNDQEWGEERMLAAARDRLPQDAGTILKHIVKEADRFAAAAPQHDDMTLLLMKLEGASAV
jgi:phosphoserine phosphatase RsbU/P